MNKNKNAPDGAFGKWVVVGVIGCVLLCYFLMILKNKSNQALYISSDFFSLLFIWLAKCLGATTLTQSA